METYQFGSACRFHQNNANLNYSAHPKYQVKRKRTLANFKKIKLHPLTIFSLLRFQAYSLFCPFQIGHSTACACTKPYHHPSVQFYLHLPFFMEEPRHKRLLSQPIEQQTRRFDTPEAAALTTLGMRIRKAVAEGYKTESSSPYNGIRQDTGSAFERVALPAHLSQPPALTSDGSTFQSGLNVSEWNSQYSPVTLPMETTKRGRDGEPVHHLTYEEYSAQHGLLLFNEDF